MQELATKTIESDLEYSDRLEFLELPSFLFLIFQSFFFERLHLMKFIHFLVVSF